MLLPGISPEGVLTMDTSRQLIAEIARQLLPHLEKADILRREYLSPREVSAMTSIPLKQLEALRSARKGPPYYKLGKSRGSRVLYHINDVTAWIEAQKMRD